MTSGDIYNDEPVERRDPRGDCREIDPGCGDSV